MKGHDQIHTPATLSVFTVCHNSNSGRDTYNNCFNIEDYTIPALTERIFPVELYRFPAGVLKNNFYRVSIFIASDIKKRLKKCNIR